MNAREAKNWLNQQLKKQEQQVDSQKQKMEDRIENCDSLTKLSIIAEDLIIVVGADYDVWMKKVDEARTMTQLRIVSADLLDIW